MKKSVNFADLKNAGLAKDYVKTVMAAIANKQSREDIAEQFADKIVGFDAQSVSSINSFLRKQGVPIPNLPHRGRPASVALDSDTLGDLMAIVDANK